MTFDENLELEIFKKMKDRSFTRHDLNLIIQHYVGDKYDEYYTRMDNLEYFNFKHEPGLITLSGIGQARNTYLIKRKNCGKIKTFVNVLTLFLAGWGIVLSALYPNGCRNTTKNELQQQQIQSPNKKLSFTFFIAQ